MHKIGTEVSWKWGRGKVDGVIREVHTSSIEKKIKNSLIKRNATADNPAYYIEEKGKDAFVLKLDSELIK